MILIYIPLILITGLSFQCCEKDQDVTCFEFDQRQCAGDEWAEQVPLTDSKAEREDKMKEYLTSKNIKVLDVNLVINFHESVCEACFICPEQDRFFVKVADEDAEIFEALDLLNSGKVNCGENF